MIYRAETVCSAQVMKEKLLAEVFPQKAMNFPLI